MNAVKRGTVYIRIDDGRGGPSVAGGARYGWACPVHEVSLPRETNLKYHFLAAWNDWGVLRMIDPPRRLAAALAGVGAVLCVLGWYQISGQPTVAQQLPYLASATIPGASPSSTRLPTAAGG